ncbi:uncharacterized protein LOC141689396 [Apium graveolens]|uniref:uncharacterized protein LOC141689396 n=1 Tax=Apium graveolens TaxID=4045 RepID=UPI003D7AF2BE
MMVTMVSKIYSLYGSKYIPSFPDAVQDATAAELATEKKENQKQKEIQLASKGSILASKKQMSNVLTIWKQRSHEGQAPGPVVMDVLGYSAKGFKRKLAAQALFGNIYYLFEVMTKNLLKYVRVWDFSPEE